MKTKLTPRNVGFGIAIILALFVVTSFIFQDTTVKPELITNDDGEQIYVETTQYNNFFSKVVKFIQDGFGMFSITITSNLKEGESGTVMIEGSMEDWCKPTSGFVYLSGGSRSYQWNWDVSDFYNNDYSMQISKVFDEAGDFRFTNQIYGDIQYTSWLDQADCWIPPVTETSFCSDTVAGWNSANCDSSDLTLCRSRIDPNGLRCAVDIKDFTVEAVVTDCQDNYCDSWERVGSISGGDEYEQVCYIYGSAPECREIIDVNTKVECDSGYEKSGDRCEPIVNDVTCYQCSGGQVISDIFQNSCPSEWYSSRPLSCGTTTTTPSTTTTTIQPPPRGCIGIESFFDYENCPTKSYILLGVLIVGMISAVLFIPFGKGGKK